MYIEPEIDDMLRNEAFNNRTSKNDLLRKYLRMGMDAAKNAAAPAAAKKAAPKRSATVSAAEQVSAARKTSGSRAARKTPAGAAAQGRKSPSKALA
jgi:hypothetical protein